MSNKLRVFGRVVSPVALVVLLGASLCAQETQTVTASGDPLPNAPSSALAEEQSSSQPRNSQSQQPAPDPKLGESSVPQQNSAQTPIAKEQPKRILYVIPNYRAVSADADVAPLDAKGKFNFFLDDSFDYSTFISVGFLTGIGMAERMSPSSATVQTLSPVTTTTPLPTRPWAILVRGLCPAGRCEVNAAKNVAGDRFAANLIS